MASARKIVNNQPLKPGEAPSWQERYRVDMRTRSLHGPEGYFGIAPEYRLWICPPDLNKAIGRLKNYPLSPARRIPGAFSYCSDRAVRASAALVALPAQCQRLGQKTTTRI